MKKPIILVLLFIVVAVVAYVFVSKKTSNGVLDAFGIINERLEQSNKETAERNRALMDSLNNSNYVNSNLSAEAFNLASEDFERFLTEVKEEMLHGMLSTNYETMDQSTHVDTMFFDGDSLSVKGEKFKQAIDTYRESLLEIVITPELRKKIQANFSTASSINRDAEETDWMTYNFKGFPLVASVTKISQMQAAVAEVKQEYLSSLLDAN